MATIKVRQSPLVAVLVARAISETGTMLSGIALPLFVWSLTRSTIQVAIVSAVQAIPLILAGLAGGPFVDRLGAKRISVLADSIAFLTFGCIPLFYTLEMLSIQVLALLVFFGCCGEALGQTARASLTPDLAQEAGWSLERAHAAVSAIGRFAIVLGPLTAGVLVTMLSPATVLLIDAMSFGLSALIIAVFVTRRQVVQKYEHYWFEVREGVQFLRRDQHIVMLVSVFSVFNLLINPIFLVILPVYTSTVLQNPTILGVLIASFGVGTLIGTLLYGAIGSRLQRRTVLISCFVLITATFWPLIGSAPLPIMIVSLFLMGFGVGPCGPLIMTTLATRTPAHFRGRVFGVYSAGVYGGIPLGVMMTGQIMNGQGIQAALVVLGIAFALLTSVLLLLPRSFMPSNIPNPQ